jgi:hypothetical protein
MNDRRLGRFLDQPFFGCLHHPCNSAPLRIDFVTTNPIAKIGRGANNDVILPGMGTSTKPFPSSFTLFFFLLMKRVYDLNMQVLMIAR